MESSNSDPSANPYEAPPAARHVEPPVTKDTFLEFLLLGLGALAAWPCLWAVMLTLNPKTMILIPIVIPPAIPLAIGYSVLRRRSWGFPIALVFFWFILFVPVPLFFGGAIGGSGRDSIGHGLAMFGSGLGLVTSTPLAAFVLRRLNQPGGRLLFGLTNQPLSEAQKSVVAAVVGILELGMIVGLIGF